MALERVELKLHEQASVKEESNGDLVFSAIAVDKQSQPNRKGFVFDWLDPADVDVAALRANPVLLYLHEDCLLPIGRIEEIDVNSRRVNTRNRIPSYAGKPGLEEWEAFLAPIRQLIKDGYLRAVSIGFYIKEMEELEGGHGGSAPAVKVKKLEIVELSVCPIGAHPSALIQQGAVTVPEEFKALPKGMSWKQLPDRKLWRLSIDGKPDPVPEPEEQPYPNEHACRLNEPGKYKRMRRVNEERESGGKPIDVIYGILEKEGKDVAEVQALRYRTKHWTEAAAKAHCKDEGGRFEAATGEAAPEPVLCSRCKAEIRQAENDWRAIPYSRHGDSKKAAEDMEWDASAEVAAADVEQLAMMCTIEDAEHLDSKGGYKMPHHTAQGNMVVKAGCQAAMGAMMGARGGMKGIPADAMEGAYKHMTKHYEQFGMEPPEMRADGYETEELTAMHEAGRILIPGMPPVKCIAQDTPLAEGGEQKADAQSAGDLEALWDSLPGEQQVPPVDEAQALPLVIRAMEESVAEAAESALREPGTVSLIRQAIDAQIENYAKKRRGR